MLVRQRQALNEREARLVRALRTRLAGEREQLRHLTRRLAACHPQREAEQAESRLARAQERLAQAMRRRLAHSRDRLAGLARQLQTVSPLAVLGRGYAILQDEQGQVVRRAADTQPGQALTARLGEGRLRVEVKRRLK